MNLIAEQFIELLLELSPWLLLGLFFSGLFKSLIPQSVVQRWLGGSGVSPIFRAAIIGAPLPLCSCSVLPVALSLKRSGASPGATISFLVSTPETGVDSISVSYALLGPFMAIARPVAAIISAAGVGIAVLLNSHQTEPVLPQTEDVTTSCCCESGRDQPAQSQSGDEQESFISGQRYAFSSVLDDMKWWLVIGTIIAAIFSVYVSTEMLGEWGQGPLAMIVMSLIGIPIYICATASTPIAAALLIAGVSPGAVLVFMLVGPATNMGSLAILRKEMGTKIIATYLIAMISISILLGLLLDLFVTYFEVNIAAQMGEQGLDFPLWISWSSAVVLLLLMIKPLRHRLIGA
jgi:hypothetical protein